MAIAWARLGYIQRSKGKNAVAAAAYQARTQLVEEHTGEVYDGRRAKGEVEAHFIILPGGTHEAFRSMAHLWSIAEQVERRWDSQTAKLLVLGLPHELGLAERVELSTTFVSKHFVSKGIAAQLDFHPPHEGDKNYHVHVELTTRRIEGDRFAKHKASDLDASVRRLPWGNAVVEGKRWGELWREHQEEYFRAHQLDILVDPLSIYPAPWLGPRRSWSPGKAEFFQIREALNDALAHHPALVFRALQRTGQQFDGRALERFLDKHQITEPAQRQGIREKIQELQRAARDRGRNVQSDQFKPNASGQTGGQDMADAKTDENTISRLSNGAPTLSRKDTEASVTRSPLRDSQRTYARATPADALEARFKTEHAIALGERKQAEQAVYDRFAGYQADQRNFYNLRHEQEKLGARRGSERHNAHEVLKAERQGDRVQMQQQRSRQLAAARRDHPLPTWDSFLKRESERGDREAGRILQQQERGRQHGLER